ncbi:hypothetical protein [Rhodanobacter sp. DHB23]|uniref:hypothetical protein n=1 Tax=Rhodanobacter sp. DHB23 TaxID=2775923 RepID=UPI00177F4032|nr:hypothetical protein [Rhodanobacter sp. DHB23]MBD8872313.1 hypothetical protein [Rhodanobacter sp. DHB23]
MKPRDVPLFVFALFCAAMMGLAVGATWMVATMYLHRAAPWLALPAGAVLAWATRHWIRRAGAGAAVLAAFATVLAALYFNVLMAAILLAGNFDLGLTEALRTAGAGMLLDLAWLGLHPADVAWYALGILLAAWLAWRQATPRR